MNEQRKPWSEFKYEPVGPVVHKLLARYLRTQRKNMLRFFQERGLYTLADRMNQIRKSRQGMLEKNRMFQEVLNLYAQQSMPARTGVLEPKAEQMQDVRQTTVQSVEKGEPGESGVEIYGVEKGEPGEAASNSEQALRLSDADAPVIEEL